MNLMLNWLELSISESVLGISIQMHLIKWGWKMFVSKPTEKVQEELSKIKEWKLEEEELVFRQLLLIFIAFYCLSCSL